VVGPPGDWMLGEDSGIEVEALGGEPGVRSARWAAVGTSNQALLARLGDEPNRRARMIAHLVAIAPDGRDFDAVGILEGAIAREIRGSGGFGYDPIFIPEGEKQTVGELGNEWKRRNSHRARAAAALLAAMRGRATS
jgi:XTP/dITP diphosphohydrolase